MTLLPPGKWRLKLLMWLLLAWAAGLAITPTTAEAHEGGGFHPEKLWALLRTGLLVAAVVAAFLGVAWFYERRRVPPKR